MTAFLDSLDAVARDQLLSVARPVSYVAGAQLVRHGEAARGAFVIREGRAEASVTLPGGERVVVATLGPGEMFGEMALIELGTCTATVRALSNLDGWFVAHEDFRALVSQSQPAAIRLQHAITAILAARIGALNARLMERPAAEDRPARPITGGDPLAGVARKRSASFEARGFLPKLAVFQRFTEDEIDEVASHAAFLELPRGQCLFHAGGEASAAFIVVRGAVEILGILGGRERRIAVLGPGQLVGYLSLLRNGGHSTHAFAREASLLLEIPAPAFNALYFGESRAAARLRLAVQASLLATMARTNRTLTRLITQAKLDAAHQAEKQLEAEYHGQLATAE